MALATLLAWMGAAAELMEGFAELSEVAARMAHGENVSDEYLATLRQKNKDSVARLKAALKPDEEKKP